MRFKQNLVLLFIIIFVGFTSIGCNNKIERSGIVVDELTNEPLQGVSIEIYLKEQRRDSLKEKVFTDEHGYFFISEKRGKGYLFQLYKSGYIGHVNSLSVMNDTIKMERTPE